PVATASAILSKFTGLLLLPILGVLVAIDLARAWRAGARPTRRQAARAAAAIAAFGLALLFLLNAAYLFNGSFRRAADYHWRSQAFQRHVDWPVPIPLPRVFTQGLDYSSFLKE